MKAQSTCPRASKWHPLIPSSWRCLCVVASWRQELPACQPAVFDQIKEKFPAFPAPFATIWPMNISEAANVSGPGNIAVASRYLDPKESIPGNATATLFARNRTLRHQ